MVVKAHHLRSLRESKNTLRTLTELIERRVQIIADLEGILANDNDNQLVSEYLIADRELLRNLQMREVSFRATVSLFETLINYELQH